MICWYDLETWGLNPKACSISQFAAIITDDDLNIIEEINIKCKPTTDRIVSPTSSLITGLNPFDLEKDGIDEIEFSQKIHDIVSKPDTCLVGFNNTHFDNIALRFLFYRNLLPAYSHEFLPNSTFDILPLAHFVYALRPDDINWPIELGNLSFRLENLAKENDIKLQAHDALEDVRATLKFAKIIKEKKPRLYDYAYSLRFKKEFLNKIKLGQAYLYSNKYFGADRHYMAPVILFNCNVGYGNKLVALDISQDLTGYMDESVVSLSKILNNRNTNNKKNILEGIDNNLKSEIKSEVDARNKRIRTMYIDFKKTPLLAPLSTFDTSLSEKRGVDIKIVEKNIDMISRCDFIHNLSSAIYANFKPFPANDEEFVDIDQSLYGGNFISREQQNDLNLIKKNLISNKNANKIPQIIDRLDLKLQRLVFQFIARNFNDTLSSQDKIFWKAYTKARNSIENKNNYSKEIFLKEFLDLKDEYKNDLEKMHLLDECFRFNLNK